MSGKFSVTVAPNGARRNKADHPVLPISVAETAQAAKACFVAGADCIHLHVRDDNGQHSLDAGRYREAIAAIKQTAPAMTVQITTEAAGVFDVPAQYACLKQVRPKAVSVSVREMARDVVVAGKLYEFAAEAGIDLQHILYDVRDVVLLNEWRQSGIVARSLHSVLFVLGKYQPPVLAQPKDLTVLLDATSDMKLNWTVCAFGKNELACMREALKHGGNIRVGFENNLQLPDGSVAPDNAQLVAHAVRAGIELGLRPYRQMEPT
jgi:uncharacterized protein (DUF849 family)